MRAHKCLKKPVLILTCGLTGTGKSTIASEIRKITGIPVIRSDVVRKQLARIEEDDHRLENFGEGIYSENFSNLTYDTMFNMASEILQKGESVLIDASFKKKVFRDRAKKLAAGFGLPFLLIECKCSESTVKERLLKRSAEGDDPSDGRWEIYAMQKADFENITEPDPADGQQEAELKTGGPSRPDISPTAEVLSDRNYLVLNTDMEISINLDKALKAIEKIQGEKA